MATPSILSEGEKLYNTFCVACHGKSGRGDGAPGMTFTVQPTDFQDKVIKDQRDGALFWKLTEGRGMMPSYKALLSDDQRWQLVAYIRKLSNQSNGFTDFAGSENSLPVTGFTIDPALKSQYFPLPQKVLNVIKSESQLFMVDTVVSGLTRPWSMAFLPDNTVLIAERAAKLLRVKNGKVQEKSVEGNIPPELRDIKLHPQYEKNGLIYITYYSESSEPGGDDYTVLMRARLDGDKLVENEILYKGGPFDDGAFWYGSKIAFDGDGYLYFTVGESGKREYSQDLSNPSGKTMRFNDDGSIPADNPFVNTPGALPEVYSYGHRMHEGLTYDSKTGEIWSTEFGELGGDEINIIKSGANYGWPEVTFSLEYSGEIISKDSLREDIEPPVHHMVIAPSDLAFVHGDQYPEWDGNLFIGGLRKSMPFLYRAVIKDKVFIRDEELLQNIGRVRDVKFGPDNFLYVMTEDTGLIVRLVPVRKN
jgi:glucose/arabinose dehydrogenase/cytochrome c5